MKLSWLVDLQHDVDSTSLRAAARVLGLWQKNQSAHGLVMMALRQTAGRGQHGRTWVSPEGGLYMSVILEKFPESWRDRLALVAGLAVLNTLESGVHAAACWNDGMREQTPGTRKRVRRALQIRWPNDILLHGKKVAGILCEGLSQGDRFAAIIGIGINVHTRLADLPEDVRPLATSLHLHGVAPALNELAHGLLLALAHLLEKAPSLPQIVQRLRPRDALLNQQFPFDDGPQVFTATGAGLQDDGALLLQLPDGTLRACSRGRIVPSLAASS
jgi:BirA family transcriptional regulator, biotin operon repressor / biotin---[acetyl-CoA-carboxylase] ligase